MRRDLGLPAHISACLFDLDGVITQTAKVHAQAWKQTFDEFRIPFEIVPDYADYVPGKPAPDTYLAAATMLQTLPANAAVYEDALAGVEAGRAGRFGLVVGIDRAGQADALRAHGADIVVQDLAQLMNS